MKPTTQPARWRGAALALAALSLLGAAAAHATGSGPVVRLFPTTVLEDIRETGQVAEDMENIGGSEVHRQCLPLLVNVSWCCPCACT